MGIVNISNLTEVLTGAAPTDSSEGVPLDGGAQSFRIIVSANFGQTLSGAGTIRTYHWNATTGWGRNPDLDLPISVSGVRSQVFSDVIVGPPVGRLRCVPEGVTVSGGSDVNIRYELGN